MPGRHPSTTLRLEPHSIPAVRAAFDGSLDEVGAHLMRLRRDGFIREPWLSDPISRQAVDYYNLRVMEAPDGPYASLLAYEAELIKIRDNLYLLENHYRRTEGDNAALWGRA